MNTSPAKRSLGEQIHDARIEHKLSLRGLAAKIERAPSYINDIEHDRRIPSEEVLARIATELDLNIDLLLAAAGRVSEGSQSYLQENPTAGVLFRRVSDAALSPQDLSKLLEQAQSLIDKRDNQTDDNKT
jgi:transcriptional regulator with XRE-family HTH domain